LLTCTWRCGCACVLSLLTCTCKFCTFGCVSSFCTVTRKFCTFGCVSSFTCTCKRGCAASATYSFPSLSLCVLSSSCVYAPCSCCRCARCCVSCMLVSASLLFSDCTFSRFSSFTSSFTRATEVRGRTGGGVRRGGKGGGAERVEGQTRSRTSHGGRSSVRTGG
jgi:hypothetical protein